MLFSRYYGILLNKLEKCGIRGNSLDLIENYLSNREQIVNLNSAYSSEEIITCGVPQESILGPLLFSIYIRMPQTLKLAYTQMTLL